MIGPMGFQEILSKEEAAVFVQDKESIPAASPPRTGAIAAIVIVDRFSATCMLFQWS